MAKKIITNIGGSSKKPAPIITQANIFNVKDHIVILPELESFIRKLTDSEYQLLERDIIDNGCKDAILIWKRSDKEYVLIDGHNRYKICKAHGIDFQYEERQFQDLDEVKYYMSRLQLGRRNLTAQESSYLRGLQYSLKKRNAGGNNADSTASTKDQLAEEFGVSPRTIINDGHLFNGIEKLPVAAKLDFLAGNSALNKSDIEYIGKNQLDKLDEFIQSRVEGYSLKDTLKRLLNSGTVSGGASAIKSKNEDPWAKFLNTTEKKVMSVLQDKDLTKKKQMIKRMEQWLMALKEE